MKKVILITILFLVSLQAKDLQKVSLQLKWKYQFQFAGFIVAKEKGFYKEIGLDVDLREFKNGVNIIEDVENADIEFGISDSSLVYEALKNKPVVAMMALFQDSPFILMGLKSSGINSIKDISGKKIALYDGIDGVSIKAMLKSNNIKYIPKPPIFTLDKLISKDIDLMTAYISNEPFLANTKGIKVNTISPKDYGFEGYGDILFTSQKLLKSNPKLVQDFYKASYKGWEYAYNNIDEVVDIIYDNYNTLNKTKEALKYEAIALKNLSKYGTNDFLRLSVEKVKGIAGQFNLLKSENNSLKTLDNFIYKQNIKSANLTIEENQYIKDKKTVNVCTSKGQEPFVIKEKNRYQGISASFINIISKKTNLKFNYIYNNTQEDYHNNLKNGKCDMLSIVLTKPNKFEYLTPTVPILEDEFVLATSINEPYVSDISKLKNKKISILRKTKNMKSYIHSIYPNLNLVDTDGVNLEDVKNGKFYGTIHSSHKIQYEILNEYSNDIKIMTNIGDLKINGSFGISNREPLLLSIINKALTSISKEEKQKITNSYKTIKVEKHIDYTLVWQILLISIVILSIVLVGYFKQKKLKNKIEYLNNSLEQKIKEEVEKNKQQELLMLHQSRLAQMGEMINMIAHQWRQPLNVLSMLNQSILLKYNRKKLDDKFVEYFKINSNKQIQGMSKTINDFRDFFKPEKEKVEFVINDVINDTLGMVKPIFTQNKIEIVFDTNQNFTTIGYPNELGQTILNIVNNSKDALVENDVEAKKIEINLEQIENEIILKIRDNAGGIPRDIIDNIFDPYFSTKDKNGTGLGLYMSKIIIEEHIGGKISVSNDEVINQDGKPSCGAIFEIVLHKTNN